MRRRPMWWWRGVHILNKIYNLRWLEELVWARLIEWGEAVTDVVHSCQQRLHVITTILPYYNCRQRSSQAYKNRMRHTFVHQFPIIGKHYNLSCNIWAGTLYRYIIGVYFKWKWLWEQFNFHSWQSDSLEE